MSDWVRHGECDSCGYCCEVLTLPIRLDFTGNDPEWMKVRGIPDDGIKWFSIVDPCPKLTEEKRCGIYENRPQQCKDFPSEPTQIEDIPCVYWFENLVTGEKVGGTRSEYPKEVADVE